MIRRSILVALLLIAAPPVGAQQDTTRVPTGVRLGLIYETAQRAALAVRPFASPPGQAGLAEQAHAIIRRDLDYSDRFQITDVPARLATGLVDYGPWNDLGLVWLVTGEVAVEDGGEVLRLTLHDVVYQRVRETRAFRLPGMADPEFRMAVHAAADEIVRWATGQPGMAASRIVFSRHNRDGSYDLMVVDSDGENLRRLAGAPQGLYSPVWSPDGRRIAYSIAREGGWHIVERELASGEIRMISDRAGLNITPVYSPDGQRMLFASWTGSDTRIFEYDLARRCCIRALSRGPRDDMSPSFSPDGNTMAFNSNRIGQPHVYVMPVAGGEARIISPYAFGEPGYYTSPDWSPTGSLVTFHGRSRGRFQIMVADAARPGGTVQQLTSDGENEDPSWGPDGRHIVFTGVRSGGSGLYVIDSVTGRIRPLVLGGRFLMADWSPALLAGASLAVRGP
jgi:TolB protein